MIFHVLQSDPVWTYKWPFHGWKRNLHFRESIRVTTWRSWLFCVFFCLQNINFTLDLQIPPDHRWKRCVLVIQSYRNSFGSGVWMDGPMVRSTNPMMIWCTICVCVCLPKESAGPDLSCYWWFGDPIPKPAISTAGGSKPWFFSWDIALLYWWWKRS